MSEPNYAGNIIVNLSSLPDFLRKPILTKRLKEFFTMSAQEQQDIVNNALLAGPDIPFPNFSKLCKTWLEVLATFSSEQRQTIFSIYVKQILEKPEKIIRFNLDGILEILLSMDTAQQEIISQTVRHIVTSDINETEKVLISKLIPNNAKKVMKITM